MPCIEIEYNARKTNTTFFMDATAKDFDERWNALQMVIESWNFKWQLPAIFFLIWSPLSQSHLKYGYDCNSLILKNCEGCIHEVAGNLLDMLHETPVESILIMIKCKFSHISEYFY